MRKFRLTLLGKLIVTNVGIILALVLLLLALFFVVNRTLIEHLIDDTRERVLVHLSEELGRHHAQHGNWLQLKAAPKLYSRMVHRALRRGHAQKLMLLIDLPREGEALMPRHRFGPPAQPVVQYFVDHLKVFDETGEQFLGRSPAAPLDQLTPDTFQRVQIFANGQPVGLLVLPYEFQFRHLVLNRVLHRQVLLLILVALIGSTLAIVASAFLARGLTAPLREIKRATAKIADRKFDQRVTVSSRDELFSLAQSINAMAESLARFEAQQKQWLEDMAHELRTPIMIVMGELEAMTDGVSQITPEALTSLHRDMQQLMRLVSDLGELARLEGVGFRCVCEPVDLCDSLHMAFQRFAKRLRENNITLKTQMPDQLWVQADAARLNQVWTNILENAVRYVDAPGVLHITIQKNASEAEILFDDSGPGVPETALPRLFDRLYRVEASRNRAFGGAGLGLSLCAQIIKKHNGQISAEPSPDGGLRLRISLPLVVNE